MDGSIGSVFTRASPAARAGRHWAGVSMAILLAALFAAGPWGCATPGATGTGASPSANSSQNSSGDSQGSGDSSNDSGDSSNQSGQSSDSQSDSESSDSGQGSEQVFAVVCASSLLATTVGGIGLSIYGTVHAVDGGRAQRARTAMLYLRANQHQLRQDLAFGAGPVIDDLASVAAIRREHLGRFGALLQQNRQELLGLAEAARLTPERALRTLERIGELIVADPVLQADYQAWRARHPELA
jgi:hypothetical protein